MFQITNAANLKNYSSKKEMHKLVKRSAM